MKKLKTFFAYGYGTSSVASGLGIEIYIEAKHGTPKPPLDW